MKILVLAALLMAGCETVYHHNTVHQADVVHNDTADVSVEDDTVNLYCERVFCVGE
mgnify:CR=1 FL=1